MEPDRAGAKTGGWTETAASEADTEPLERVTGTQRLEEELHERILEGEALREQYRQVKLQIEALRGDWSARQVELEAEIEALRRACDEHARDADRLRAEIQDLKSTNRTLKSQNLMLQYHLSAWGIPVGAGRGGPQLLPGDGKSAFFPELTSLEGELDPVPVILRGDLATFGLPDLLCFLENSHPSGVLTVLTDEAATKLYLERGCLRLATWNRRDRALSLAALLVESEFLAEDAVRDLGEDLFDFELAKKLFYDGRLEAETIRECLKEHARVLLSRLFEVKGGSFFFQPGRVSCERELLFELDLTDVILRAAAGADERARAQEAGGEQCP